MEELGIKRITSANWLQHDSIIRWGEFNDEGQLVPVTGEQVTEELTQLKLADPVPREIKTMFEVTRGLLIYGYFFYPLYAVALDHQSRMAEAAITKRYEVAKGAGPESKQARWVSLAKKIDWLRAEGVLNEPAADRWHTQRLVRNSSSHPSFQTIAPPGMAITSFHVVAEMINGLFADTSPEG